MLALASLLAALACGVPGLEDTPAPVACPDLPTDLATLVPEGASVALSLDVDAFAATSVGRAALPSLRADLQIGEILEVIDDCHIQLERTYSLLAARDRGDGRIVVLQARGIGEPKTLACLSAELTARNDGVRPWAPAPAACGRRFKLDPTLSPTSSSLWVVNPFSLVWAQGAFEQPVGTLVAGGGSPALPESLEAPLARVDRSAQLWLVAALSDRDRRALPPSWTQSWAVETTSLSLAVDFSSGLSALATFATADIATLASLRERVLGGLSGLAQRLDDFGIEHELREHARVGIVEQLVIAEVELDLAELAAIRAEVGERIQGRGPL